MNFNKADGTRTREGRAYIALASMSFTAETKPRAEALAFEAADLKYSNNGKWCAWHAVSSVTGTRCPCADCR